MFTHLHTHSTFSDGLAEPYELVRRAYQLGFSALALTDHNTLAGHSSFLDACETYGIQPLLGAELRVHCPLGAGHMVILSQNADEYQKLQWLIKRKKQVWLGDLKECGIVTSGCLGGVACQYLLRHDYFSAQDMLELCAETLEGFCIELQATFGTVLSWLIHFSRKLDVLAIATNDVHYLEPEEAKRHLGLHLSSEAQMRASSPFQEFQYAIESTQTITEKCSWYGRETIQTKVA